MPAVDVVTEVRRLTDRGGSTDAQCIADLAVLYDVSEQAMEFRLLHLGLRRQI